MSTQSHYCPRCGKPSITRRGTKITFHADALAYPEGFVIHCQCGHKYAPGRDAWRAATETPPTNKEQSK